ncbi:DegT/DnrJ/EryC1/StrS family aminotransferase [Patescibacteria group bacterium]|nr:DegT/DnrJ/EryC1/StrS family aminotransferase [Patescibacteria group bacterium]
MKKISWWEPIIGDKEKILVDKVLKSNFLNDGELTAKFEKKVASLVGSKYAIAVTSGTMAIYLALKAVGVGRDDEVIIPDMTFIATANAVEMCGAKPVLVDVDPETLTIDMQGIKKAITKKTKAIIPVHVSGRPADINEVLKIAKENNLFVIEDAAEAFMSKYKGRYLGTYGDTGCFSFSPPKIITTGQGGIIVTNNTKIYQSLKELKDHGRPNRGTGGNDIHYSIGFNFKYTNLQAAVGLGQLFYLKKRMQRMKKINFLYRKYLNDVKGIKIFDLDLENGGLPLWTDALVEKRDALDKFLKEKGIHCRRFWFPIHTQKPYKNPDKNFPNSSKLSSNALWLPSAFTMTDKDVKYVATLIKDFLND